MRCTIELPSRAPRIEPLERRAMLASGELDGTFAGDGSATISFPGAPFQALDVALQPDGKVVLAGTKGGNVALVRLNVNGTLDASFGTGGLFEWTRRTQATDVLVQPDGKILVAFGAANQGFTNMAVGRIRANGAGHDSAFGTDGIAHVGEWGPDVVHDIALQHDGKIIAAGGRDSGDWDFAITRYNADGSPDNTFDSDGIVTAGFGDSERAFGVAVDYNGSPVTNPYWGTIVVVGDKRPAVSQPAQRVTICRLRTNGSFDTTFDGDGKLTSPDLSINPEEYATDVLIQPGGRIVISGCARSSVSVENDFLLARYLPSGALDGSFGPGGSGIVQSDFGSAETATESVPSYLGGFIVTGLRGGSAMLAAYTPDGLLDGRFRGTGWTSTPVSGSAPGLAASGNTVAPIRRLVVSGGAGVSRYWDLGITVSISTYDADAAEAGQDRASILVERSSNLGRTDRVFLSLGGTARPPYLLNADWTAQDMNVVSPLNGASYIDIDPAFDVRGADVVPVDDALPEADETVVIAIEANDAYDVGTASSVTMIIRDNDSPGGPDVAESAFLYETAPQRVTFRFSQNVSASIGADDFAVSGPGGNVPFGFAYDATLNTATLTFGAILADGNYTARAIAAGITNGSGQPMAADHVFDFFVLAGDANRDRRVNLQDFNRLAANFGQSNRTFSQGDFNYDGSVTLQDFNILAARFGQTVAPAASGAGDGEDDTRDLIHELT